MPALTRARVLSINAPQHIAQEYLDEINEIVDFVVSVVRTRSLGAAKAQQTLWRADAVFAPQVIEQVPHLELIPVIAKAVEEHGPFIGTS